MRITIDIDDDTREELDRYKHHIRDQWPAEARDRETVAAALLNAWAHAQQRKRKLKQSERQKA